MHRRICLLLLVMAAGCDSVGDTPALNDGVVHESRLTSAGGHAWFESQKIVLEDAQRNDSFGVPVAISSDTLVVWQARLGGTLV